jgi:RNA ligase partner protein
MDTETLVATAPLVAKVNGSPLVFASPLVFDTSLFTNPDCSQKIAHGRLEAFHKVLCHVSSSGINMYMTPGCWEELSGFIDVSRMKKRLVALLRIVAPDCDELKVSGTFLKELVTGFRERGDKSIKYACKAVSTAYQVQPKPREKGKPHPVADHVSRLREVLRRHLREGFIDSATDLETILLAKQLGGRLVTGDEGMKTWARRLGVELLDHELVMHVTSRRKRVCPSRLPDRNKRIKT